MISLHSELHNELALIYYASVSALKAAGGLIPSAQHPAGAMTHPGKVLLEFAHTYKETNTRPFTYVGLLNSSQPAVLEHLRQITSLRSAVSKGALSVTSVADRTER